MAAFTELLGDDDPDGEPPVRIGMPELECTCFWPLTKQDIEVNVARLVPKIVQQCIFPEVGRRLRPGRKVEVSGGLRLQGPEG